MPELSENRLGLADEPGAESTGPASKLYQRRPRIVQVQKKTSGKWIEVDAAHTDPEALGKALMQAQSIRAYRVLEVVSAGERT